MSSTSGPADQDDASSMRMHASYRRQSKESDKRIILISIQSTMVNGRPKKGIFTELANQLEFEPQTVSQQWHKMNESLQTLLSNHPNQDVDKIIRDNTHILFGTKQF